MVEELKSINNKAKWTAIGTAIAGGILVVLQGVNLTELGQVGLEGNKRMEALQQLLEISKDMDHSLKNQNIILENGTKMLTHDEKALENQSEILNTLKQVITEQRQQQKQGQ